MQNSLAEARSHLARNALVVIETAGGAWRELCTVQCSTARRTAATRASVVPGGTVTSILIAATRHGGVSLMRQTHRTVGPSPSRPETTARVVCDARREGGDEEIRRRGTRVLAAGVAWLIDDQFVASNSDPMAIAAEADNCKFHGGLRCR